MMVALHNLEQGCSHGLPDDLKGTVPLWENVTTSTPSAPVEGHVQVKSGNDKKCT